VDNAGDKVIEEALDGSDEGGVDTVQSSVSFALGKFVENLTLTGTGDIDGTGNELNNTIAGNNGDNILKGEGGNDLLIGLGGDDALDGGAGNDNLQGGAGNDLMAGGAGNDVMTGGPGNDTYLFKPGFGSDQLIGFDSGDLIDIRGFGFTSA